MSVRIEVPDEVEIVHVVYFRGGTCAPGVRWLQQRVRAWVRQRVGGALRDRLLARLHEGRVLLQVVPEGAVPLPDRGLIGCTGLGIEEAAALDQATHAVVIGAVEPPGPTAVWLGVAASRAVARAVDGVGYDPELSVVHPLDTRVEAITGEDLASQWRVYGSEQGDGCWLTCHGQGRLGLPPIEALGVPQEHIDPAANLLCGVIEELASRAEAGATLEVGGVPLLRSSFEVDWFNGLHGRRALRVHPAGLPEAELGDWIRQIAREQAVVELPEQPSRLRRAIERSVAELSQVRARFARGLAEGAVLYVRVEFPAGETSESMWVAVDAWSESVLQGRLANHPHLLDLDHGDPVTIEPEQLRDWAIEHAGGRLEGGRTMGFDVLVDDAA